MNKIEKLTQWLGDRQRNYADGLSIFEGLARKPVIEAYLPYFQTVKGNIGVFDPHFTQLVNIMVRLEHAIHSDPHLYPSALDEVIEIKALDIDRQTEEIQKRQVEITSHEEIIGSLKSSMMAVVEENAENEAERMDELQAQVDEHEDAIDSLRSELEELGKPGIKVVTEASMPTGIKKAYARVKEIAPLYASLHNDIANPSTPDDKRKELAEQLCKLDDERRRLWKQIDDWSEGKGNLKLDENRPVYSDDPIVRGFELARAMKRLKQNIRNSSLSAERAKADGRQVVCENAMQRIAGYQKELAEIEAEIAGGTATE